MKEYKNNYLNVNDKSKIKFYYIIIKQINQFIIF